MACLLTVILTDPNATLQAIAIRLAASGLIPFYLLNGQLLKLGATGFPQVMGFRLWATIRLDKESI
jgi:hypothetical protein